MEIDKTTLTDLSIFSNEDFSVFNKINLCRTSNGSDKLFANFHTPLKNIEAIQGIQQSLQFIIKQQSYWPTQISNGTVMVVEKFYEAAIDEIPSRPGSLSAFSYKLLHGAAFSFVKYSTGHCFDFIKGLHSLLDYFLSDNTPVPLKKILQQIQAIIDKEQLAIIKKKNKTNELNTAEQLQLARFLRYHYKNNMLELLDMYAQLDAWYGMAQAVTHHKLVFPELIEANQPVLDMSGLYHLLLQQPVAYDVKLLPEANFIFLTGANMAGKSTFIKSVGISVFLAHIGMGVPAQQMRLTVFEGLLSNINVVDNVIKGESYFYNEVQRIKATIHKISDGKKWLILIDELFKGTNVQDAMKCSSAVIEGLIKIKNSLFILSTHLYEISEDLKKYSNISFKYFETSVSEEQLQFNYQLKNGISNDRLGYLILKKEGVVDLLKKL